MESPVHSGRVLNGWPKEMADSTSSTMAMLMMDHFSLTPTAFSPMKTMPAATI